jgi:SAM-dependent methyltransferase
MFRYINTVFKSKNPRFFYHKLLFTIITALIIYYIYKLTGTNHATRRFSAKEGFEQEAPFVQKQDLDIYDDFYATVYDGIYDRPKMSQRELVEILKMTEPDTRNSTMLDIGSGTGSMVGELTEAGYNVYGVDQSTAMIEFARAKYSDAAFVCGNIDDAMAFDRGLFTHILCTHFTIYEMADKAALFRNCYSWLKPNGYLIVHLVDRDTFSARTFKDGLMDLNAFWRTMQPVSNERKTATSAEFIDYIYSGKYEGASESANNNTVVTYVEKFVDKETRHIRQNENTLHMEPIEDILRMAAKAGFIVHAKTSLKVTGGDANQYLYVLERAG